MASIQGGQGDLTSDILQALSQNDDILSSEAFPSQKSADVKSSLDRLASRSMITYETIDREEAILEPEAQEIAANGSHEARVFEALSRRVDGLTIAELETAVGDRNVMKVGQGKAFKSKWITKGKDGRLVASVSFKIQIRFTGARLMVEDTINRGYDTTPTTDYTRKAHASGPKGHHRFEEAEVGEDAKGHKLQNTQGSKIRFADGQRRDRPDCGYACFVSLPMEGISAMLIGIVVRGKLQLSNHTTSSL
jgi:phenylalanyl-tRNA synthetase alpha chain